MATYKGLTAILREFKRRMLLAAHPVYTVYMTTDTSFDPNTYFGGTWQKLPDGVFIRNAGGDAGAVGTTQQESLPDIRGTLGTNAIGEDFETEGAFKDSSRYTTVSKFNGGSTTTVRWGILDFKASNSNGIYNGNHVTPYNYAVHMWLRTA